MNHGVLLNKVYGLWGHRPGTMLANCALSPLAFWLALHSMGRLINWFSLCGWNIDWTSSLNTPKILLVQVHSKMGTIGVNDNGIEVISVRHTGALFPFRYKSNSGKHLWVLSTAQHPLRLT